MKNIQKQFKVQIWDDISSEGNEYDSMYILLASSKREGWQSAKLGRMVLKYHNWLLDTSKDKICNSCDYPLDTAFNVRLMANEVVHRTCQEYPKEIKNTIDKAVKDFNKR